MLDFLGSVVFNQVVVFCNQKGSAEDLAAQLKEASFPAAFISGGPLSCAWSTPEKHTGQTEHGWQHQLCSPGSDTLLEAHSV